MVNSATGTRTRVARVRVEYPNQLDYGGHIFSSHNISMETRNACFDEIFLSNAYRNNTFQKHVSNHCIRTLIRLYMCTRTCACMLHLLKRRFQIQACDLDCQPCKTSRIQKCLAFSTHKASRRKTPTVGLEPTTTRLRALRSTD